MGQASQAASDDRKGDKDRDPSTKRRAQISSTERQRSATDEHRRSASREQHKTARQTPAVPIQEDLGDTEADHLAPGSTVAMGIGGTGGTCKMCGSSDFEYYAPWGMYCCTFCNYPLRSGKTTPSSTQGASRSVTPDKGILKKGKLPDLADGTEHVIER